MKSDLEVWLEQRHLEVKPVEREFIRERALNQAASRIADKLVAEFVPLTELQKEVSARVEKLLPQWLESRLEDLRISITEDREW